ncbi:MAG: hypothetical protein DLM54_03145 [Acidimicrobiales bacterium]|nr:MAG: hypothetical protein DLM54_03145 [Acidimicrobiales bacterium]
MMPCAHCAESAIEGRAYCTTCGRSLSQFDPDGPHARLTPTPTPTSCRSCGIPAAVGRQFCRQCGADPGTGFRSAQATCSSD